MINCCFPIRGSQRKKKKCFFMEEVAGLCNPLPKGVVKVKCLRDFMWRSLQERNPVGIPKPAETMCISERF